MTNDQFEIRRFDRRFHFGNDSDNRIFAHAANHFPELNKEYAGP
jgi:hypothetical protein